MTNVRPCRTVSSPPSAVLHFCRVEDPLRLLPLLLLLACQRGGSHGLDTTTAADLSSVGPSSSRPMDSASGTVDTYVSADTGGWSSGPPTGLNGTPPETSIPLLSSFSATNRDGEDKGPTDLMGSPTVMWFYPAAATGG